MTLTALNQLPKEALIDKLTQCCGATAWVNAMAECVPYASEEALLVLADELWATTNENDWREAFSHHPKIGDLQALKQKFASTAQWAAGEQGAVSQADETVLNALAAGNDAYEKKFGFIFIVCATGKSANEMLHLLQQRLPNDTATELRIAMGEQQKITRIRLQKLLS